MALTGLAIGLGSGLVSGLFGLGQRSRARRLERNNIRPVYQPNSQIAQNLADAQQLARRGLPSQIYSNQLNQMQQGLATGLRGLGRGGVSPYNVATLLSGYNRGLSNLNAMDAQAMEQNRRTLFGARQAMAQEEARAFEINQLNPYLSTAQEVSRLRGAGDQNIFGGLGLMAQTGAMYGAGGLFGGNSARIGNTSPRYVAPSGFYRNSAGITLPTSLGYRNYL